MKSAGDALAETVEAARRRAPSRTVLVGIAGAQGSGKSTLSAAYWRAAPRAIGFSLDDVYFNSAQRGDLARRVHPLLQTRGPPGTHDLDLLNRTIDQLAGASPNAETPIPQFDKVADEPAPRARWPVFRGRPDVILLDGWCMGAAPQSAEQLRAPMNRLEADEDGDGVWRTYVNDALAAYQALFSRMDAILYLQPPSFEIVLKWRSEQEEGLLGRELKDAERLHMGRFIAHFERITRHMMAGGMRADMIVRLDEDRNVRDIESKV